MESIDTLKLYRKKSYLELNIFWVYIRINSAVNVLAAQKYVVITVEKW